MYLTVIAWMYVVLMMAVAEATSPAGTLLGAVMTFLLYGLLPLSIVVYLMGTPARRRAIKAQQAAERAEHVDALKRAEAAAPSGQPDASGEAPTGVASLSAQATSDAAVREKP